MVPGDHLPVGTRKAALDLPLKKYAGEEDMIEDKTTRRSIEIRGCWDSEVSPAPRVLGAQVGKGNASCPCACVCYIVLQAAVR